MRIDFRIGQNKYFIEQIKIKDYYKIKTQLFLEGSSAELAIVSALSGCPVDDLKKIPVDKWEDLSIGLSALLRGSFADGQRSVIKFNHDGVDYALCDMNKMTIGEFSDLDVIVTSDDAEYRLHEVLAILFRPIISKTWNGYKIQDYDYDGFKERSQIFLDVPISIAQSVSSFFLDSVIQSIKRIKIYSKSKESMEVKKIIQNSQEMLTLLQDNGTLHSLTSQEKIHSKFLELQNSVLEKLSTSLHIAKNKPKKSSWKINKWLTNITA